jgi:glucose-1-phosphate cytidylyltransferase
VGHSDLTQLPRVAILCGGRGTRLQEHSPSLPKPLVEIGGRPIVWHVIQIYLAQGFRRVLLLTGYRGELIERFVRECDWPSDAEVECLDTGLDTPTGGRVRRAAALLEAERFCLAYSDGVADIDLRALLAQHDRRRPVGTMTVVHPLLPFGLAELNGDGSVRGFVEKPQTQHWVNAGFFCFEPAVLDLLAEPSVLEQEPLAQLASRGELHAFCHHGFWECMDTYKHATLLNDLWLGGRAPWKLWP